MLYSKSVKSEEQVAVVSCEQDGKALKIGCLIPNSLACPLTSFTDFFLFCSCWYSSSLRLVLSRKPCSTKVDGDYGL